METLYKPIPFSPQTKLTQSIGEMDTVIQVDDINAFPDAPNLATIGIDENAETILYAAKTENSLSGCTRGVEGTAKTWQSGKTIARYFTAKDHQAIINSLQTIPNKNLLDNWYFLNPVNQREKSGTISETGYFFDRWILVSGTAQIIDNGIILSGTIKQILEFAAGENVTASALTTNGMINASYDDGQKTYTLTATGQTIIACKLEIGKNQTLARQKEDGLWELLEKPDYSAELEKCQRFLLALSNNSGIGYGYDAEIAYIFVSIPTAMAKVPVYINNNTTETLYPTDGNNVDSIAVISQNNPPANIVALIYRGKNFVPARPYSAYMMNGLLSAEL